MSNKMPSFSRSVTAFAKIIPSTASTGPKLQSSQGLHTINRVSQIQAASSSSCNPGKTCCVGGVCLKKLSRSYSSLSQKACCRTGSCGKPGRCDAVLKSQSRSLCTESSSGSKCCVGGVCLRKLSRSSSSLPQVKACCRTGACGRPGKCGGVFKTQSRSLHVGSKSGNS